MKPNLFGLPPEELRKVAAGILGSYKSEKKSAAARLNGAKSSGPIHPNGGRPKGSKNKPKLTKIDAVA